MGEGFPLWSLASMAWEGREPLRDWICLSVSLYLCVPDSGLSPFLIFPEIRNSDWTETFAVIFYQKIAYGWPTRVRGAPPASWAPRAPSRIDFTSQKSHIFQKNLRKFLSSLDSVWYGFSAKQKTMQQTGTGTGHWINMLVPKNSIKICQKYMKVEEYWHGTIKNYRYVGDVSSIPKLNSCSSLSR